MAAISFTTRAGTWKGLDAIVVVLEECRKINYRHKSDSWEGYKYAKPFATDGSGPVYGITSETKCFLTVVRNCDVPPRQINSQG